MSKRLEKNKKTKSGVNLTPEYIFQNKKFLKLKELKNGREFCSIWIEFLAFAFTFYDPKNYEKAPRVPSNINLIASEINITPKKLKKALDVFLEFKMIRLTKSGFYTINEWYSFVDISLHKRRSDDNDRAKRQNEKKEKEKEKVTLTVSKLTNSSNNLKSEEDIDVWNFDLPSAHESKASRSKSRETKNKSRETAREDSSNLTIFSDEEIKIEGTLRIKKFSLKC